MDNINQLKFVDLKLNDAIQKIIDVNSDAIFVVEGDVFCGTLKLIQGIDEDNFIYVTDTMDIGEVHSSILSEEFIALRVNINEAMKDWQPAVAITDIDSVQAFPEAYRCVSRGGKRNDKKD